MDQLNEFSESISQFAADLYAVSLIEYISNFENSTGSYDNNYIPLCMKSYLNVKE